MMRHNQKIPEGWSVKKVKDLGRVVTGSTPSMSCPENYGGTFCWATAQDFSSKYISDTVIKLSEQGKNCSRILPSGSVLITCIASLGLNAISKVEMATNQQINAIIPNKENNGEFIYYQISYNTNQLKRFAGAGGMMILTKGEFEKVPFIFPPLPEQEKIADILGTWDEAIEKLSNLIEQKKLLKKGLMQKLIYTRTNATKYKVADLFELGRGRVISKNEIDTHQGVFPVYSSQTSDNGILGYINTYDFQGEYITWTTDGANAGEVFYRNGKFNCTNVCGTAKAKEKNVNLYYAMSFLNHVSKKYVSYVGNPKLMNGVFAIIPLILPNIEIQNKVADILSTADDEINLLNQKLEALKEQKKGLMQQLLTGQIRVKVN